MMRWGFATAVSGACHQMYLPAKYVKSIPVILHQIAELARMSILMSQLVSLVSSRNWPNSAAHAMAARCYRHVRFVIIALRASPTRSPMRIRLNSSGAHAAAVRDLIPALRGRGARRGAITDGNDSFPRTDGGHLPASRM